MRRIIAGCIRGVSIGWLCGIALVAAPRGAALALTPTPTPLGSGPRINYFRPINPDGCEFCCSSSCAGTPSPTPQSDAFGRPIYARSSGRPLLVVEARRGPSNASPGSILYPASATQRPDLQMLADHDLGTATTEVCDTGPSGGGVPAVVPPDFRAGQSVTNAMVDLSCRFTVQTVSFPCTKNRYGDFAFMTSGTDRQYCFQVPTTVAFPSGDTVVAVQVRDVNGNLGERKEIVVRVGGTPPSSFGVSGQIHYYRGDWSVPGAGVQLLGSPNTNTTTSAAGEYSFTGLSGGAWTVQPETTGNFDSGVSALDAAYVLQVLAQERSFDSVQNLACDVTADGSLSTLDASRILQRVVGKIARFAVAETCASDWVFFPSPAPGTSATPIPPVIGPGSCQRGGIRYDSLASSVTGQDFNAALFGDCTGNWAPPGGGGGTAGDGALQAWLHAPRRPRGRRVFVTLGVDAPGPFFAVDAELAYDPTALRPLEVRPARRARGAALHFANSTDGLLRIAMARGSAIDSGADAVARLVFEVLDDWRGGIPLQPVRIAVDEVPALLVAR